MATRIEITCVIKTALFRVSERISSIGGRNFDGKPWQMSQAGAIRGIEDGKYLFYINRRGKVADVIVGISSSGDKYLKTLEDTDQPTNLLALPDCPWLPPS